MSGYICKIVIEDTHPPVWRRVMIPDKITFEELHEIIQLLFGWGDIHLHDYRIPADHICIDNEGDTFGRHYDESETLIDPFFRNYKWIRYTYDFGDDWRHRVNIEKIDENFIERTPVLLKYKGDNFLEDGGGVWNMNENNYRVFEREYVEERLRSMPLPRHEELPEAKLLKESMKEFKELFQQLVKMEPETLQKTLDGAADEVSKTYSLMKEKIDEWKDFEEYDEWESLRIIHPEKSQQELLMALGEKEASDYYKYLRLPQTEGLSREDKVNAVSEVLRKHPEYLCYVFDEDEYRELEKWIRMPQGTLLKKPEKTYTMIKSIGLGLADFILLENGKGISFAIDISEYIGVVNAKTKRRTYHFLDRHNKNVAHLLLVYGLLEIKELYNIYRNLYDANIEEETFLRFVYWHCRFNDFVNTSYRPDGTSYIARKGIEVQNVIRKIAEYASDLPYAAYTRSEIDHMAEDLSNRSEWVDIFFTTLHYMLGLEVYEAQGILFESIDMITNGDTLSHVIEWLRGEIGKVWNLETETEVWTVLSGLMLELELPMLKGRSRMQYAKEMNCSPWSIDMVSEEVTVLDQRKRHMYQFSSEVQEWMYEATGFGSREHMELLLGYKEKHQVISEEYIYQLANVCVTFGETKMAEKLIAELKKGSREGRKTAKLLEERLRTRQEVVDDEDDWFENDTSNWFIQEEVQQPFIRTSPKIGRNDPCPCGSGKKYKKCCGRN